MADARVLLGAGRFVGAYHAGGIALECMLKARIARATEAEEFLDLTQVKQAWTHQPAALLSAGDLVRFLSQASHAIQVNWATVKDWKIESRYNPSMNPVVATALVDALDHPTDGVLTWLRSHC
jgi:hypothetical protein